MLLLGVLVGLLAACSTGSGSARTSEPSGPAGPSASSDPSDVPSPADPAEPSACAEVRAGIDDFNDRDYAGTVSHFEEAVPLAEEAAAADGSPAAADLLEAVEYYAALAPQDYPDAARTSPDFARYKAITLGQCASSLPPGSTGTPQPTEPGVPV